MIFSETKRLEADMAAAQTYDEWKAAAIAHDKKSGVERWVKSDESKHFDHVSIRRRLRRLRRLKAKKDYAGVLFALNEGIHGNIDGMGSSALYGKAKFSTKKLIVDYVDEVVSALDLLASSAARGIPANERLDFFRRAHHCYGCSSLMMSGAGCMRNSRTSGIRSLRARRISAMVIEPPHWVMRRHRTLENRLSRRRTIATAS